MYLHLSLIHICIQTLAGVTQNGFSSTGFYVGFLLLIILVVGLYVAYTGLIKRETSKALHAVINFVVVFVLSASFIAYAPDYIKKINEFSSDISTASLDLGTKIMLPNSCLLYTSRQVAPNLKMLKKIDKGNGTDYMKMIEQQAKLTEKHEMIIKQQTTPAKDLVES